MVDRSLEGLNVFSDIYKKSLITFVSDIGKAMWQLLIHPWVPYFFCGIIIAIFFGMLFLYGRQNKKLVNESITRAVNLLKTVTDRKTFYEQYESIGEKFLADGVFHNAWEEFDETVEKGSSIDL